MEENNLEIENNELSQETPETEKEPAPTLSDLLPTIKSEMKKGTLSEETLANLALLGISEKDIEELINLLPTREETREELNLDEFGGQKLVNKALEWAQDLDPQTKAEINAQLAGTISSQKEGLKNLMSLYFGGKTKITKNQGPFIITSKTRAKSMPNEFSSLADLQKAVGANMHKIIDSDKVNRTLHDPEYQRRIMEGAEAFRSKNPKSRPDYTLADILGV